MLKKCIDKLMIVKTLNVLRAFAEQYVTEGDKDSEIVLVRE